MEKFECSANPAHKGVNAKIELARRTLEKAAAALNRVIADALRRVPPEEAPLSAWPFICGSNVAHRTRALDLRERILRVQVPDNSWRTQLMELAPRYLAALNSILAEPVTRIQFLLPEEVRREQALAEAAQSQGSRPKDQRLQ